MEIRDALAERAQSRGQSLQAFLLDLITNEARRTRNRSVLARFAGRSDGSRVDEGETAEELRALREQRDLGSEDANNPTANRWNG